MRCYFDVLYECDLTKFNALFLIHDKVFRDHLNFIRMRGEWKIFSKIHCLR